VVKRHKCFELVDEKLKENNTRLSFNLFNWSDVFVATERIENLRDGKRAKVVIASFCPFCGKKLNRGKTSLIK
jgi:hypothetical protein